MLAVWDSTPLHSNDGITNIVIYYEVELTERCFAHFHVHVMQLNACTMKEYVTVITQQAILALCSGTGCMCS